MFSLQTIFGKGDKFYGLLEASAGAARESARALGELLSTPPAERSLERFKAARQREKDLQAEISQQLVNTFVTALEREDIEELSSALYKIPKVVEKFAERYALASERVGDVDFIPRAAMPAVACAFCDSTDTEPTSAYGCHMLTAQYYCRACRSSFDWVRDEWAELQADGNRGPGVG